MNKIFKVIWSKAKNSYVVVSEIAKRNGKCSSSLNKKLIAAFLAAGAVMSVTGSAWADTLEDTYIQINSTGKAASAEGADAIAIGMGAVTNKDNASAIGVGAGVYAIDSIAFGSGAIVGIIPGGSYENYGNAASIGAIAIGTNANSVAARDSVVIGADASTRGLSSTVIGTGSAIKTKKNFQSEGHHMRGALSNIYGPYNVIDEKANNTSGYTNSGIENNRSVVK